MSRLPQDYPDSVAALAAIVRAAEKGGDRRLAKAARRELAEKHGVPPRPAGQTGGPAMPAVAPAYLSPPKIAERLGIDQHKVLAWIRAGELRAVDVGDGGAGRASAWRRATWPPSLAARSAGPQPKISRVRRRRDTNVTEFF